jgi:hypothetical protein
MKRPPDLWKHAAAGLLLVLAAALWNVQYHRVLESRAEEQRRRGGASRTWRPVTPEERKAVAATIKSQLDAFRKDDYETASLYQSTELKTNFPSVQMFRRMMKYAYPQFTDYQTVSFGRARADPPGDHVEIRVTLTGRDKVTVQALYRMVREGKMYRVQSVFGGAHPNPSPRKQARPLPGITV